jgi:hypothetical protein
MNFDHLSLLPGNVGLHLSALSEKVDDVAARAGVSAFNRLDLESTLGDLSWRDRRRLGLILEGARVSANSEALRTAVDMLLGLASDVWVRVPPPQHTESSQI